MTQLVLFRFDDEPVNVLDENGQPWFVLADVCRALELTNPSKLAQSLESEEKRTLPIGEGVGNKAKIVINESGLYSLTMRSRKEAAKRFKKWVTSEVLPSIRKTGTYGRDTIDVLNDPIALRGLLLTYTEKVLALQTKVGELTPKADALDLLSASKGSLSITDAANTLNMSRTTLIEWGIKNRWWYRRNGKYEIAAYRERIAERLCEQKVMRIEDKMVDQCRLTARGLTALAVQLRGEGLFAMQ